jgi:hypothetical protein
MDKKKWGSIFKSYFGSKWIENELKNIQTLESQKKELPITVEKAIEQVQKIKNDSKS